MSGIRSRVLGGLAAVAIIGVGMDYLMPLLAPHDYVGVHGPQALLGIPIVLGGVGYLLCTWRIWAQPGPRSRRIGYAIRAAIFLALCSVGFWVPTAYVRRQLEFVHVSREVADQASRIEGELGFKVGARYDSTGAAIFFRRQDAATGEVRRWLREHGGQPTRAHLNQ